MEYSTYKKMFGLLGALPFVCVAQGQNDGVSAVLSASSLYNNNATSSPDSATELEEQQNRYGLSLDVRNTTGISNFALDYDITYDDFTRDSQSSDTSLSGQTSIFLGTETSRFALNLQHSIRQLIETPDVEGTTDNLTDRQDLLVAPELRLRPSNVDDVIITATYTELTYEAFDANNTSQLGVEFEWQHDISATTNTGLVATQNDTEFSESPELDYQYRSLGLAYESSQRLMKYRVVGGINEIESRLDGETESGNYYDLDLGYENGYTSVNVLFSQELSDTSYSNRLTDPTSNAIVGGNLTIQDRVNSKAFQINLGIESLAVCRQCSVELIADKQEVRYLSLEDNDSDIIQYMAQVSYRPSRASEINVSIQDRAVDFPNVKERAYSSLTGRISYSRRINPDFTAYGFYDFYSQEQGTEEYDYNRIGLRFAYEVR